MGLVCDLFFLMSFFKRNSNLVLAPLAKDSNEIFVLGTPPCQWRCISNNDQGFHFYSAEDSASTRSRVDRNDGDPYEINLSLSQVQGGRSPKELDIPPPFVL